MVIIVKTVSNFKRRPCRKFYIRPWDLYHRTEHLSTASLWSRDPQAKVHGSSSGISSSITSSVLKKQNELILAEWQADTIVFQGIGVVTFLWCCIEQSEFNFPPESQHTTLHCTGEPYLISRTLKARELKNWKHSKHSSCLACCCWPKAGYFEENLCFTLQRSIWWLLSISVMYSS